MDNLTHSLLGAALGKSRLSRLSPLAAPLLIVAANLPDLDILVAPFGGREAYLLHHRGLTHAFPGLIVQALLLAALARWVELRRTRAGRQSAPSPWRNLLLLTGVGLASHLLLDALNVYGIRPWLPFDERWYYGDVAFIVDPWLWLLFGGATALAGGRSRGGSIGLALCALLAGLVVVRTAGRTPLFFHVLWPAAVLAIGLARWKGVGLERGRAVLTAAGMLTLLYLGGLTAIGRGAAQRAGERLAADGEQVLSITPCPQPADPLSWTLLVETPGSYHKLSLHLARGWGPELELAKNLDLPAVQRALADPCTRAFRSFARQPFATVEVYRDGELVQLMDARYLSGPLPVRDREGRELKVEGPWCGSEALVESSGAVRPLEP